MSNETKPSDKICSTCSACGANTGCGASLNVMKHTLSRILVETLIEAVKIVNEKEVNCYTFRELQDRGISYEARNNHQKLRYFGLIAHVKDDDGKNIRGSWLITSRGGAFLRGEEAVLDWVSTFRNKIKDRSTNKLYIGEVLRDSIYLETYEDIVKGLTIATPADKARAVAQRGGDPVPVAAVIKPVEPAPIQFTKYIVEDLGHYSKTKGMEIEIEMGQMVFGKPISIRRDGQVHEFTQQQLARSYKVLRRAES